MQTDQWHNIGSGLFGGCGAGRFSYNCSMVPSRHRTLVHWCHCAKWSKDDGFDAITQTIGHPGNALRLVLNRTGGERHLSTHFFSRIKFGFMFLSKKIFQKQ